MESTTSQSKRARVVAVPLREKIGPVPWRLYMVRRGQSGHAPLIGWEDARFINYTAARKAIDWYEEHEGVFADYCRARKVARTAVLSGQRFPAHGSTKRS